MRTFILLSLIGILFSNFSVLAQHARRGEGLSEINAKRKLSKQKNSSFYIDQTANIENFVKHKLFGNCAVVSNIKLNTNPINKDSSNAVGVFVDSSATIGLSSGLLLTTGSAYLAQGPNNSGSVSNANNLPGDSLAGTLIPGYTTYDATILEFDFVPLADSLLAFEFVFASEEYPEYANSSFNDVFGFFLSGPGINGYENIAKLPGTNIPISINTVNLNTNSQYYIDNTNGTVLQYDAYTTVFQIVQPVIPLETYHYKIVIADAGDQVYDSGVFLAAESFTGLIDSVLVDFNYTIDSSLKSIYTVHFTNNSSGATEYSWDFGDGNTSVLPNPTHTYSAPGVYNVTLNAQNYCYNQSASNTLYIGTTSVKELSDANISFRTLENGLYSITSAKANINELSVFNQLGQLVYIKKVNKLSLLNEFIDLRAFPHGIYTIKGIGNSSTFIKKVIR